MVGRLTVPALFPETAAVADGELAVGGVSASSLAERFGTPLLVYCEQTLLGAARAYRRAAPDALVVYGVKAFPNVALLRLFAAEGLGADVSTLGELEYARKAGVPAERLVVHGNNKSDEELRAAAEAGAGLVVLDALDEIARAATAGVRRVLVRVTPGIDAETHDAIRTAHLGSKFGLPPGQALEGLAAALDAGLEPAGLHVHVGSQLLDVAPLRMTVDWLAAFAAECLARLAWVPAVVNLGGGLGVRHLEEDPAPSIEEFVGALVERVRRAWELHDLPAPRLVLEPGRSLVGTAAMTLYRVGVVKHASERTTYVAVDGGMSDNPRPQLYGARYTALLANRADEPSSGFYTVCGKHCESGDVLIERLALPEPRRGDLLAVPATGAYTLGMGSNYNAVPRPAVVLVAKGQPSVIRSRETVADLLAFES
ncbi:MAG: diaminopimelate decarboxylase [Actinobacteria bacterium]|nr:diaminopimelate decarboxylase [Actinomycetota bacterium]